MTAWLILASDRFPRTARALTRRVAGRFYRFSRLRVVCVSVVTRTDPTGTDRPWTAAGFARVRFASGIETWAPVARLASDRPRFLSRWIELSGATEVEATASGDARLPAPTGPTDRQPTDRSNGNRPTGPTGTDRPTDE